MKKIYMLLLTVALTAASIAQVPGKMSYQAVIRYTEGNLVTEQEIGMQISILQGSADGTVVYTETQTPLTNKNGLVSIEIGGEAGFADIEWSDGPYFLKTETDPEGGTNYTISGTNQLLTVPYALHAKTAEIISEPIIESDPVFEAHLASDIEAADISNWDEAYFWGDHAGEDYLTEETDPVFEAWDRSTGIEIAESQISDLQTYYLASNPDGFITAYIVTEGDVTAHQTALSISESQITDLQSYLTSITGQSIGDLADVDLTGIAAGKLLKYDAVEEKWVISDDLGLTEETDPVFNSTFNINSPQDGDLLKFDEASQTWVEFTPNYAAKDHDHLEATTEVAGFMSAADKEKLDGLGGSLSIGDSHQGGIIFWLDASGEHGLIAAPDDQSEGIQWYNEEYTWTTVFASSVGAGYGNTRMIVYKQGAGDYAAQLCRDLSLGEFDDWYLPSKYELNLMYQNIGQGNLLGLGNVGGFASGYYWSSTEFNNFQAWYQYFGNGIQGGNFKFGTIRVRAVRAF